LTGDAVTTTFAALPESTALCERPTRDGSTIAAPWLCLSCVTPSCTVCGCAGTLTVTWLATFTSVSVKAPSITVPTKFCMSWLQAAMPPTHAWARALVS
jgi:hypothetical protein